jgi:hypothetical protein
LFSVASDGLAEAGDYIVCISKGAAGFKAVPHASGRYLTLSGTGAAHPAGFFRHQQFSAKAGAAVTLSVGGFALDGSVDELAVGASCSGTTAVLTSSSSSTSAAVFNGDIPVDWEGVYKVCQNETGEISEIGTLAVTKRPDLGVSYVVTPGEPTSLEVTGTALDYMKDRVMVVDCNGVCGVSGPAPSVKQPTVAVSAYLDRSAVPETNSFVEVSPDFIWATIPGPSGSTDMYCPGNLVIVEDSLAEKHRCYSKCFANSCNGEGCFCDGYESGFDTEESSSLCLDVAQCTDLCAQTEGCTSIDMHATKSRCFLNTGDCAILHPDPDYDVWFKESEVPARRTMSRGRSLSLAQVRELVAGEDPGVSWDTLLRFDAVLFAAGGEFKLCFCDPSLLASGIGICTAPSDYKIEVGTVQASGIECLLTNPKMQRGNCVSQTYGGLRCYDGVVPATPAPAGYLAIPDTDRKHLSSTAQLLLSFCQFAPEEETLQFPFCSQHRQFVAPVG